MKRPPALRVRVPDEVIAYEDGALGPSTQHLAAKWATSSCAAATASLPTSSRSSSTTRPWASPTWCAARTSCESTPRQIWLARALGLAPPRHVHVPVVVAPDGTRLEKRTPRATVRSLRDAGVSARAVVGALAHGLGLWPNPTPASAIEVARAAAAREIAWPRGRWSIPIEW